MIEIIYFSLVAAGVNALINYCIGKPSSEFSPYEIFSFYTVWLSKRRLKQVGLWTGYLQQYDENISRQKTPSQIIEFENDFKRILYNAADPFFTWERMVGMCPVCTGFWISLIIGFLVTQNISGIIEIIVFSHITIRILNKIL